MKTLQKSALIYTFLFIFFQYGHSQTMEPNTSVCYEVTIFPMEQIVQVEATIKNIDTSKIKGWIAGREGINLNHFSAPKDELHFSYLLEIPNKNKLNSTEAILNDSIFRSWGWDIFVIPSFSSSNLDVQVTVKTPKKWNLFSNYGEGKRTFNLDTLDSLLNLVLFAGDLEFNRTDVQGIPLLFATRKVNEIKQKELQRNLSKIISTSLSFLGEPYPKKIIFIIDSRGEKNTYAPGNNVSRDEISTTVFLEPDNVDMENPTFYGAYAHEFIHTWIPAVFGNTAVTKDELGSIFKEGFTDYLAYRIAYLSGVHSEKDFINSLNKFYQEYQDIRTSITNNSDKEFLNYRQGMMAAFILDLELQKNSRGKQNIFKLFRSLIKKYANSDGLTKEEFNKILFSAGGKDLVVLHQDLIDPHKEVEFGEHLQNTGIKQVQASKFPKKGSDITYKKFIFDPTNKRERTFLGNYLLREKQTSS